MKKRNIILIVIGICIIIGIGLIFIKLTTQNKKEVENENVATEEIDIYDKNVINEIKNEINATADTDMYQIEKEYDGRQILQIKPQVQFQTVLAGIIKNDKPLEEEIQGLIENKPTKNGVWIAKPSRQTFLNLLKDNEISNYAINEEGYLHQIEESNQEEAKKLKVATQSNQLYILDISGTCYTRDDLSGEIIEYPFEKMEPYQAVNTYEDNNNKILVITTNEKGKLSNQEILKDILLNLE